MAEELRECLGSGEVVLDPAPDDGLRSPWRTYRACLERAIGGGDEHVLVVQEDVIVCDHLLEGVEMAVAAQPNRPLVFFVPGRPPGFVAAMRAAVALGEAWAPLPLGSWIPAVANVWPVSLAADLLEWFDGRGFPSGFVADDEIIGRFLRHADVVPLASVPSLVEHPDTVPSVMNGHRRVGDGHDPGRRASFWIGDDDVYGCDARRVAWSGRADR